MISRTLYDLYLSNLRLHRPEATSLICPICHRQMDQQSASEGHILPRGASVRYGKVPECERCNNQLGSACDSHLTQMLRFIKAAKGELSVAEAPYLWNWRKAGAQIDGKPARLSAKVKKGQLDFRIYAKDPSFKPKLQPDGTVRGTVSVQSFHPSCIQAAAIHSAYLAMFHHFGYEWVLSEAASEIRSELSAVAEHGPDDEFVNSLFRKYEPVVIGNRAVEFWKFVSYVAEPRDLTAFAVVLPLRPEGCFVVLLPGFGDYGKTAYSRILNFVGKGSLQFSSLEFDDRELRLTSRECKDLARQAWDLIVRNRDATKTASGLTRPAP
jgi:hypothetical protein